MSLSDAEAHDRVWIEGTNGSTVVPRAWAIDPVEREALIRKFRLGKFVKVTELIANGSADVVVQ